MTALYQSVMSPTAPHGFISSNNQTMTVTITIGYGNASYSEPPPTLDYVPRGPFYGDATRATPRPVTPRTIRRERRPPRASHAAIRHVRRRDPLVLR